MSMEMKNIYRITVSEQPANVDENVNLKRTCKCQRTWKSQKYIDLSFPLGTTHDMDSVGTDSSKCDDDIFLLF